MDPSDLPDPPLVLDLITLADVYGARSSNLLIGILETLLDKGGVHSTSTTRSVFRTDYEGVWEKRDLNRISIQNRSGAFKDVVTEMRKECGLPNGVLQQRPISPKIDLIALARIKKATIITFDYGDSPISIKVLASKFGVKVFDLSTLI